MSAQTALARLRADRAFGPHLPLLTDALQKAADPDAVAAGLGRLLEAGGNPFPHLQGWIALIDASPISVNTLAARPGLLQDIPVGGGVYDRLQFEKGLDEQLQALPGSEARLELLRAVRLEETLRICWQDVVSGADLNVVVRRISDLAEIMLERVLGIAHEETAQSYGRPWHEEEPVGAAVVAMGKLGGAELNYSSDIDLIFVYGKDGRTDGGAAGRSITNREYFHRLFERVVRVVGAVTPAGRLYRVDLRLRPEGSAGSLARSLASSLAYYGRLGETWERQALLKARMVAGDPAVGQPFVAALRSWAYGRGLTFEEISSLKRIKQRLEERSARRGEERREVKLGYGGIRDVEYVIQFLQLLHGAHHPDVVHHNSLTALRRLEQAGAILPQERDTLDEAYRFLRTVEHRLQLVHGAQVHIIPEDAAGVAALARRCGFEDSATFLETYHGHAEGVREVLNHLFHHLFSARDRKQARETDLVLGALGSGETTELERVLAEHGMRDTGASARLVETMTRETSEWLAESPRPRKFLADLFPRLLDALRATPDPDATLRRLEAVTAHVGGRAVLYQAMASDERLLQLLVDLTGTSAFLSNILVRWPGVLDQLVDALRTSPDRGLVSFEDIPTGAVPMAEDPVRILLDYKNLELLRIGLRDMRSEQNLRETGEELSRLADIVVQLAFERVRREAGVDRTGLVVVALGKLGGRELSYGSDLDLVFFTTDDGDHERAAAVAQKLVHLLVTPTEHGRLYNVDLRLRPIGETGPLVATPAGFRNYFEREAGQVWERLAYSRARAIAGRPGLREEVLHSIQETVYAPGFGGEDAQAMAAMREKVAQAAAPSSIRRGAGGGVVDIEFVAQMYALQNGHKDPRYREGHTLRVLQLLEQDRALRAQRSVDLQLAYRFLLGLESRIRIVTDLPEDRLPDDPDALRVLARRLGYVDTTQSRAEQSLTEEYAYHREVAAGAFRSAVDRLSVPPT